MIKLNTNLMKSRKLVEHEGRKIYQSLENVQSEIGREYKLFESGCTPHLLLNEIEELGVIKLIT